MRPGTFDLTFTLFFAAWLFVLYKEALTLRLFLLSLRENLDRIGEIRRRLILGSAVSCTTLNLALVILCSGSCSGLPAFILLLAFAAQFIGAAATAGLRNLAHRRKLKLLSIAALFLSCIVTAGLTGKCGKDELTAASMPAPGLVIGAWLAQPYRGPLRTQPSQTVANLKASAIMQE